MSISTTCNTTWSMMKNWLKIKLTINSHLFLHKIFVDKTADFASVGAAQLGRRPHDLDGPVLPVEVGPGNLVLEVEPVSEEVPDCLRRSAGKPLKEGLRIVPEKPFDVHLIKINLIEKMTTWTIWKFGLEILFDNMNYLNILRCGPNVKNVNA